MAATAGRMGAPAIATQAIELPPVLSKFDSTNLEKAPPSSGLPVPTTAAAAPSEGFATSAATPSSGIPNNTTTGQTGSAAGAAKATNGVHIGDKHQQSPVVDSSATDPGPQPQNSPASPELKAAVQSDFSGPFLQYLGMDASHKTWRGSVLVLTANSVTAEPDIVFSDQGRDQSGKRTLLDTYNGWKAWRFDLEITLGPSEKRIDYAVKCKGAKNLPDNKFAFFVPGVEQQWHWAFHSCNGLSSDADYKKWGGASQFKLWKDVLSQHEAKPMHLVVGGGDQLYNDGVWTVDAVQEWLQMAHSEARLAQPWTPEMENEAGQWLFEHYRKHWGSEFFRDALASIPQIMVWDDHDIFDGWGSYPKQLLNCNIFQGMYHQCRRFYLLFQHHTTVEKAHAMNGFFGPETTYPVLRQLGPRVTVLMPDTRAERTKQAIMSPKQYDAIFEQLEALPQTVRHVVIVLTVPIVFPSLPTAEWVWKLIDSKLAKATLSKTGLGAKLLDKFGTATLLDDITDHWDAGDHNKERHVFIKRLQEVAERKGLRFSFISGDVHCTGVGRLYTFPKLRYLRHDARFMPQITSSAIVNAPPPDVLIKLLHRFDRSKKVLKPVSAPTRTREKMVKIFRSKHPKTPKLLNRRQASVAGFHGAQSNAAGCPVLIGLECCCLAFL